ncbi:hypothetical protein [Rhizobium leguminosarum]|uniref:hypothetical protein n=1 Tax=Rhizobium leguminosarum TaxID=384 RepID=UPI001C9270E1|nr:hypothetical protein [Rhizobium leguminosarum]MBY2910036.1 hypothetical protein [Rhizobium leguminosarum]
MLIGTFFGAIEGVGPDSPEVDSLRAVYDRDPDPTDDPGDEIDEPSDDWPAAQD